MGRQAFYNTPMNVHWNAVSNLSRLLAGLALAGTAALAAAQPRLVTLGVVSGGSSSYMKALSNAGTVGAGISRVGARDRGFRC